MSLRYSVTSALGLAKVERWISHLMVKGRMIMMKQDITYRWSSLAIDTTLSDMNMMVLPSTDSGHSTLLLQDIHSIDNFIYRVHEDTLAHFSYKAHHIRLSPSYTL